jgi:hypothetical protein
LKVIVVVVVVYTPYYNRLAKWSSLSSFSSLEEQKQALIGDEFFVPRTKTSPKPHETSPKGSYPDAGEERRNSSGRIDSLWEANSNLSSRQCKESLLLLQ